MTKKAEGETKDILKVLFPGKDITIAEGEVVTMKPLSLEDLTKVIDAFNTVANLHASGTEATTVVAEAMREVLLLLKHCVSRPLSEIPAKFTPELIDIFIEQNLDDATMGKWTALIQRLTSELKGVEGLAIKAMKRRGLGNTSQKE